jgi:acetolactate synthase-1/2/3 large subunit
MKFAAWMDAPGDAPATIAEAFRQLHTGRARPVHVEMAMDIMKAQAEVTPIDPPETYDRAAPDPDQVAAAAKLLGEAKNPLIFAGGGAVDAGAELQVLAELLQAPVVTSRSALGVIDSRHALALTSPHGHERWKDADVVLGVGTRLAPMMPAWGIDDGLKFIRLDIDTDEMMTLKAAVQRGFEKLTPQMPILAAIRSARPEDGIFVEELTQPGYVARMAFPVYQPRTYIHSGYQGTLGYALPTAMGAKVGMPDRKVLAVSGDGGFMFNVQELAAAAQHGIDVVLVVFNDGAFGNVKRP